MAIKTREELGRPLTWREEDENLRELDQRSSQVGAGALLTGLSLAYSTIVDAGHTVLQAIGFLQKQTTDNLATLANHVGLDSNPHHTTKEQVLLGSADNTADLDKPVSTLQAAAIAAALACAEAYADALRANLWVDCGNFDASLNLFPAIGGTGNAGAILKGNIWTISVPGVLGGHAVTVGNTVRALGDAPAQTDAYWAIGENNIGYVPENAANKNQSGGYAGLTLFKQNLINAAGTVISWFVNTNTGARTYTLRDRDGTLADDTDLAALRAAPLAEPAYFFQPAHTALGAGDHTLTIAELLTAIIEATAPALVDTWTFPTGVLIEAGVMAGMPVDSAFDFRIVNTGADALAIGAAPAGLTFVGPITAGVPAGASQAYRVRRTAVNTYSIYFL